MSLRKNSNRKVTEHEDGSITVHKSSAVGPSTLINPSDTSSFETTNKKQPQTTDDYKEDDFNPHTIPNKFLPRDSQAELLEAKAKVDGVLELIKLGLLKKEELQKLQDAVEPFRESFDDDFDIREELSSQLKLIRLLRNDILNDGGGIKHSTTVSEVKSVLDASMKLSQLLSKANKELITQERIQAMESCFLQVVNHFPVKEQLEYVELLERKMKVQEALRKEA